MLHDRKNQFYMRFTPASKTASVASPNQSFCSVFKSLIITWMAPWLGIFPSSLTKKLSLVRYIIDKLPAWCIYLFIELESGTVSALATYGCDILDPLLFFIFPIVSWQNNLISFKSLDKFQHLCCQTYNIYHVQRGSIWQTLALQTRLACDCTRYHLITDIIILYFCSPTIIWAVVTDHLHF